MIGTASIGLAFACGVAALISLLGETPAARHHASSLWDYASAAGLQIKLGIFVDPLSVFMVLVVTGVSTLIHLYSYGYMQSDRGYHRFFSYLNFFVFSMLLLVLAGNFVLLIVGWAFVGFASYALISFWYRRSTATRAGMKAFVINVVGDIGLVLAAFLIFRDLGTFEYSAVFAKAPHVFHTNEWSVTAICLLLLVGAFAKSAQLPFHTWLPDAMEGPTPVSSLIHAATMVTAGVYLIARMHVLFVLAPDRRRHRRLHRLGDAFGRRHDRPGDDRLKARDRLFDDEPDRVHDHGRLDRRLQRRPLPPDDPRLLQGPLVHGRRLDHRGDGQQQDIDEMSGFGKAMRFTSVTMLCGALALAAFPVTSGFFSKDEILAYASARGGMYLIFTVFGYLGALLTAIYTFRLIFRVLPGRPCKEAQELIDSGHVVHAQPQQPRDRRGGGHRRWLPRRRAPHRRAGPTDEDRDGGARLPGALRRSDPGPRHR